MTVLECKICGGGVVPSEDKTYGTCDSCGRVVTLPKVDDEQKAGLFNRGNTFRIRGEFDKAAAVFERIIDQDESDAEAHWCLALCRYGVEYVEDPKSGERKPTLNRMSYDLFINDVDCQAAIQHSDDYTAGLYREEAERITEIQKRVLAISNKEEPYDIFICYKEKTEGGSRTKDSVIAQDIYYELTKEGYRVFFARITLEDKLGVEYEPYIFAALNSAKVMVVVGTSPENLNAVWVRNEWKRFLSLMKNDRSRLLIPCYRDMDPYDLPDELAMLQAQDMSKIGFMQDLIRGIIKVMSPVTADTTAKASAGDGSSNLERLVQNSNTYLKLKNYSDAREVFERITKEYPEDYRGWWGLILCGTKGLSESVDEAALQKLNTWFSYARQLSKPEEFEPLKTSYVDYIKLVSDNDAGHEADRMNRIKADLSKRIQGFTGQIQDVERNKYILSNNYESQSSKDDKSVDEARKQLAKRKREIPKRIIQLIIGAALVYFGVILFLDMIRGSFEFLSAIFLLVINFFVLCLGVPLTVSSLREIIGYRKNVNSAAFAFKQAADNKERNRKQYEMELERFNSSIAAINDQIRQAREKIADCDKYLAFGNEKIAEMLFAKRCGSVGITQPYDINLGQLRDSIIEYISRVNQSMR